MSVEERCTVRLRGQGGFPNLGAPGCASASPSPNAKSRRMGRLGVSRGDADKLARRDFLSEGLPIGLDTPAYLLRSGSDRASPSPCQLCEALEFCRLCWAGLRLRVFVEFAGDALAIEKAAGIK
jgi:hypothetical protein